MSQHCCGPVDTDIKRVLTSLYLASPCAVESTALWKVFAMSAGFRSRVNIVNGEIDSLTIASDTLLRTFWQAHAPYVSPTSAYDTMILHDRYLSTFKTVGMSDERYFRLFHDLVAVGYDHPGDAYTYQTVDVSRQADLVAHVIGGSYPGVRVTAEDVADWTRRPVFDNDLWVLITERSTANPVALGIAELDREIGEGSLEWIQVLPQYRGQGLGTALVNRLLGLLKPRAAFGTVSGAMQNPTRPERLYRRCGFGGDDVWHVFRKWHGADQWALIAPRSRGMRQGIVEV